MRARILSPVEARIAALEREWQQHTPAFSGAVSKANALGAELASISRKIASGLQQLESGHQQLESARHELGHSVELQRKNIIEMWERIEFMRREMLFEIKYTGQKSHNQSPVATRIVAGEKVANARESGLRLNLGCGHIPLPGYVNVDQRALPHVDIVAEAGDVPIETGTVKRFSPRTCSSTFHKRNCVVGCCHTGTASWRREGLSMQWSPTVRRCSRAWL